MAGAGFLVLLDDIATVLDDIAVLSKLAAKRSAGALGGPRHGPHPPTPAARVSSTTNAGGNRRASPGFRSSGSETGP